MADGEFRRFQNTIHPHLKFWQVQQEGRRLHFVWGRLGTSGAAPLTKEFSTINRASNEMESLINEKLGRGYVEVDTVNVPLPVPAPPPAPPTCNGGHAWHRAYLSVPAMTCLRCRHGEDAPLQCYHPDTYVHVRDQQTRCVTCGVVNPPAYSARSGGRPRRSHAPTWGPGFPTYDPPPTYNPPPPPPPPAQPEVVLRPRRKITLED